MTFSMMYSWMVPYNIYRMFYDYLLVFAQYY
jgi:hypothetical protein